MKAGDIIARDNIVVDIKVHQEYKVNWVVGNEAGVTVNGDPSLHNIIKLDDEPQWQVIFSAAPTYQSTVANMSEDELRASIDGLRVARVNAPAPFKKPSTKRAVVKETAMEKMLKSMSPEKRKALEAKLGLI